MVGRPQTRPTDVSVVLEYLVAVDDFVKRADVVANTGLPHDRVRAALANLINYKCVQVVVEDDEVWYMATPELDTRTCVRVVSREGVTRRKHARADGPRVAWRLKFKQQET